MYLLTLKALVITWWQDNQLISTEMASVLKAVVPMVTDSWRSLWSVLEFAKTYKNA